jgi:hypothetical protein
MNRDWDPRTLVTERAATRLYVFTLLIAFVVVVGFVAMHHEGWRDEADPWLYARDADVATIVARSRYAGLPALWFLCLAPLAKLALPYAAQSVLHLAIAAAAVATLAFFAPFSRLTKLLAASSYYLGYEYSIIVRSYALTVLLVFAAAALFDRRRESPAAFAAVIALLVNCNAQGFVIGGTFAALFVLQRLEAGRLKRRDIVAAFVMGAAAVLSFLQVRTPPDPSRQALMRVFNPDAFSWIVANGFFPTQPLLPAFLAGAAILFSITLVLRRSREGLLLLWLPLAALGVLHSYVWLGGLRHAGFVLVIALAALWIGAKEIDPKRSRVAAVLLNISLLFSAGVALRYWIDDTRWNFSGASEMATFIRDHQLDRYEIAAHNLTQCEALLPYLPHTRFWYAGLGDYGTYLKWDAAQERALDTPYPMAEARARQHFAGRPWLLLFNVEIPDPAAHGFRLLYKNQQAIFEKRDERYWLYAPVR